MKVHHVRNATMIIESGNHVILIDPMLGDKGESSPPFTLFRFKSKRNPIVDMPSTIPALLEKVTHVLVTHLHPDHIDAAGKKFLKEKQLPVTCSKLDEAQLKKDGLNVVQSLNYWKRESFLGGEIEGIPGTHGYGFVSKIGGNVMGFYLELPNEPSIYLSSDTVYTTDVDKVLKQYKPKIGVVASGTAQLDIFQPLLMTVEDIVKFAKNTPGEVISNHMEAVNHCPTTRIQLKEVYRKESLSDKTFIPEDGEAMEFKKYA